MSAKIRVIIDVEFDLQTQSVSDIKRDLTKAIQNSIGNGMLTGSTDAEVDGWSSKIVEVKKAPTEEQIINYYNNLAKEWNFDQEKIIKMIAKSGMQEPHEFIDKMRSVIGVSEEERRELTSLKTIDVIKDLSSRINFIYAENKTKINYLVKQFNESNQKDFMEDMTDDAKNYLSERAAGLFTNDDESDAAMEETDVWINKNLSHSIEKLICFSVVANGMENTEVIINNLTTGNEDKSVERPRN